MTYDDIHPSIRAAIGCHEGFRKLGFRAEDIYVCGGDPYVQVILRTQGKQFVVNVAPSELSEEEFQAAWMKSVQAVNDGSLPQEDLDRIWQESMPFRDAVGFSMAIFAKGIHIPKIQN